MHSLAKKPWLVLPLVTGAVLACSGQRDSIAEPGLGKNDVADAVSMRGALEFGAAVEDEIREDFEFHGYLFRARAGARISLEVTQLGSSRGFDTTLFVYAGGATGWGPKARAVDNDSGFGKLSEIEGLELDEQATYLAVVGTPLATGRGRYRLELRCDAGDCIPEPMNNDPCPGELETFIRECVAEQVADAEEMSAATAFDLCTESPFAGFGDEPGEVFEDLCTFSAPAPDWCILGVEEFVETMIPACIEKLAPEFTEES